MIAFAFGLIIGVFIGASLMWWYECVESTHFPSWTNDAHESASEWLRRGK